MYRFESRANWPAALSALTRNLSYPYISRGRIQPARIIDDTRDRSVTDAQLAEMINFQTAEQADVLSVFVKTWKQTRWRGQGV